jgi:hypothetical protein
LSLSTATYKEDEEGMERTNGRTGMGGRKDGYQGWKNGSNERKERNRSEGKKEGKRDVKDGRKEGRASRKDGRTEGH